MEPEGKLTKELWKRYQTNKNACYQRTKNPAPEAYAELDAEHCNTVAALKLICNLRLKHIL